MNLVGSVSVAGRDQKRNPKINQDATITVSSKDFWVLIACDGAGSKSHGAIGSSYLCKIIKKQLISNQIHSLMDFKKQLVNAVLKFRKILSRYCEIKKIDGSIEQFATTLMVCLRKKHQNRHLNFCGHIGDGAILYLNNQSSEAYYASLPENGEYVNQTYFVTDTNWQDHLRVSETGDEYEACFAMTDGVTAMALSKDKPFNGFIDPILNYISKNSEKNSKIALENMFCSDRALSISLDDKSICWFIKC
jgi:hypothetical protein